MNKMRIGEIANALKNATNNENRADVIEVVKKLVEHIFDPEETANKEVILSTLSVLSEIKD